jgi:hypothetical protein
MRGYRRARGEGEKEILRPFQARMEIQLSLYETSFFLEVSHESKTKLKILLILNAAGRRCPEALLGFISIAETTFG